MKKVFVICSLFLSACGPIETDSSPEEACKEACKDVKDMPYQNCIFLCQNDQ